MSNVANARQIRFVRRTSSYWRVTFDHPPLNIFGPETIPQLNEIVTALGSHLRALAGARGWVYAGGNKAGGRDTAAGNIVL